MAGHGLSLERRVEIACTSLRTNVTVGELAVMFAISRSQAHRIVADIIERVAVLLGRSVDPDCRWSWVVDGTLVPTRDHATAAKSKNSVVVQRPDPDPSFGPFT